MRLTWKSTVVIAAVVGLIAFFGAILVQQAWAQAKGPADFEFAGGAQGKVVFSHEKHLAKSPKCTDCHVKIFKMTKGQRSSPKMADMEKGQSCGTCHNGKVSFNVKEQTECAKCHKKG
ncbi:MAG: cytochrome c3 family protein [Candidatus Methylomirabilota bacterium]